MSPTVGDIIRITAVQDFLSQVMLNVFFYQVTAIPVPAEGDTVYGEFLTAFKNATGDIMRAQQHDDCSHRRYVLENLTNAIDLAEMAVDLPGLIGGDPEPSFQAFNVKLVRTTAITRHGSKRMGGLPESAISGNGINLGGSTFTDLQNCFAAPLEDPVQEDVIAIPVIVGRTFVTEGDGGTYVLDLDKINPIQSAILSAVSTQRSRKLGAGI